MHHLRLSRRSILKGMGASAALLPLAAHAGPDDQRICRLVVMYTGNGVHPSWGATGSGDGFELSEPLAPLEPYRAHLAVVEGVAMRSLLATEHSDGTVGVLTGRVTGIPGEAVGTGISVDQRIAQQHTSPGGYTSLDLNAWPEGLEPARFSWTEGGGAVGQQSDPAQAFADVFGGFMPPSEQPAPGADRRAYLRRSVVDTVGRDFRRVRDTLGTHDRRLIERHIESLDALSMRLQGDGPSIVSCDPTAPAAAGDTLSPDDVAARGRAHAQVLAMAMACDRTRVGTLAIGLPSFGLEGHHDASHSVAYDDAIAYDQFNAAAFGDLIQAFDDAGILHDTLLVCVNELGKFAVVEGGEADHSADDMPFLFAGGLARGGQSFAYGGEPNHNYLLAGMLQAFGIDAEFFGHDDYRQSGQGAIVEPFAI